MGNYTTRLPGLLKTPGAVFLYAVALFFFLASCADDTGGNTDGGGVFTGITVTDEQQLYTTSDWISFTPNDAAGILSYSFDIPETWLQDGTVFTENDIKVAEIAPPVMLASGQSMPDHISTDGDVEQGELIREDEVEISGKTCLLRVIESFSGTDSGVWYQYCYYIRSDDTVFIMVFYTFNKDSRADALIFESILSTIKTEIKPA